MLKAKIKTIKIACCGLALAIGCSGSSDPRDGLDDSFLAERGKGDTGSVQPGSPEADAVLALVDEASFELLDDPVSAGGVGLDKRAAANIVAHRVGDDEVVGTQDDERFDTLAELDAIKYVGPFAFGRLLSYVQSNGLVAEPAPPDAGQTATSKEQCFVPNASGYMYHYLDLEPPFTTDGLLQIRHRGGNPIGPTSYSIDLEVAPGTWEEVATTFPTDRTPQDERHTISAAMLTAAHESTGWLRLRNDNVYTGGIDNCVEISLTVNCAACLECPAGTLDLGIGCQPLEEPYRFEPLKRAQSCSDYPMVHTFAGVPRAAGAGTLSFDWAVCGSGTATVEILANETWNGLTTAGSSGSCRYNSTEVTLPRSLINAAIDPSNSLQLRFKLDGSCRAGMGCETLNDPCMRNLMLTFPREQ